MKNIYIAGCGGMLGEAVHRVFLQNHHLKCSDIEVNAPWLEFCDFRDFNAYQKSVEDFAPDILVHLGAHTDLEYCHNNPDDAYRTNTLAVEHACTIAQAHGVPLVYISTAGIFDGRKNQYDDWDVPNPLGVYARSKHLGEIIVESRMREYFICRAGWMMGGGPDRDKKFVGKIMRQLAAGAKILTIVDDKHGTPTYTLDFARNLEALIASQYWGLYNMVCGGQTNRLEVAREIVAILGLQESVEIKPVSSEFFADEYFSPRPASERLVNYKLELRGLNLMRDWRVALRDYIDTYYTTFAKPFAPNHNAAQ
ncbi:MAG: SDR family oxidoreductase [Alphaproteobacteria bacterium]